MNASKTIAQSGHALISLRIAPIATTDAVLEEKPKRRLWQQMVKFFLASVKHQRNDFDLRDWQRLEYRNDFRYSEKFCRFEKYGQF